MSVCLSAGAGDIPGYVHGPQGSQRVAHFSY